MEINGKVDANSRCLQTSSSKLALDQTLNGGMMSNFEWSRRYNVGGSLDSNVEEMIRREMEKKRIREEILTAEYLRRRELEEEVIRELILEGKIPMQRSERFLMGSEIMVPVPNWPDGLGFGSSLALAGAEAGPKDSRRLQLLNRIEGGTDGRESLLNPFQRQPEAARSGAVIRPVINLPTKVPVKPMNSNAAISGLKRKYETPTVANSEEISLVSNTEKKVKWSCGLCDVIATCEENLKAHFNGKKHKAKEKDSVKATIPKSNNNLSYSNPLPEETKEFFKVPKVLLNSNSDDSNPLPEETKEFSKVPKDLLTSNSDVARRSKFWCSMCYVGATSEVQMNAHRTGNKHMKLIKERGGGVIAIKTTPETVCYDDINELSPKDSDGWDFAGN